MSLFGVKKSLVLIPTFETAGQGFTPLAILRRQIDRQQTKPQNPNGLDGGNGGKGRESMLKSAVWLESRQCVMTFESFGAFLMLRSEVYKPRRNINGWPDLGAAHTGLTIRFQN